MTTATIHVTQGNGGNLLSFKTAQELGLVEVKIKSVEIATAQRVQDHEFSKQESNLNLIKNTAQPILTLRIPGGGGRAPGISYLP